MRRSSPSDSRPAATSSHLARAIDMQMKKREKDNEWHLMSQIKVRRGRWREGHRGATGATKARCRLLGPGGVEHQRDIGDGRVGWLGREWRGT